MQSKRVLDDAGTCFVIVDSKLNVLYVNYDKVTDDKKQQPAEMCQCASSARWLRYAWKLRVLQIA